MNVARAQATPSEITVATDNVPDGIGRQSGRKQKSVPDGRWQVDAREREKLA